MNASAYLGGRVFDGEHLRDDAAVLVRDGVCQIVTEAEVPEIATRVDVRGDIISPGYVDLQVNGGGGVMFNSDPSAETLSRMALAHRELGVRAFLPTLITDAPAKTNAAIGAVKEAIEVDVPGVAGLHLEGPHLALAKKGAHSADLVRPMTDGDLTVLLDAADNLPALMVTVAPEAVTLEQVRELVAAGVLVSLGHTDTDFDTACAYFDAGVQSVTHLFNAMSGLHHRSPGLPGAVFASGAAAGLIADAVHVHPAMLRMAWAAKTGPLFLVSDAMAVAGSDQTQFMLNGREITRSGGQLTLEDGTLAGADLDLTTAVRVLVVEAGIALEEALAAAVSVPEQILSGAARGSDGMPVGDVIRIRSDLSGCVALGD